MLMKKVLTMTLMNFRGLTTLCIFLSAAGCQEKKTASQAETSTPAEQVVSDSAAAPKETQSQNFGQPISLTQLTPLESVFKKPETFEGKTVLLEGYVQRACSKKGCWMEIASDSNPNAQRCRVKFKDYAFFVPRDSAGSNAKIQGVVQVNSVKKERVDHLEAEGARFAAKQADGSALEVQIVATGVSLKKS